MERVPKIDGYTMPPPRMGGAGAVADMELNAMFKSVLHRPTTVVHTKDSLTQDPLKPYKVYHLQPSKEDPSHPWSPNCAFNGAWYAYFDSVQKHARSASRKLFARQELETIWDTERQARHLRQHLVHFLCLPYCVQLLSCK